MRFIHYILLSIISLASFASNLVQQADSAYIEDRFENAINLYEQAIAANEISSEIYYNLGNAYYRADKLGKSILCYERALLLDPTNNDAKTNLNFVKTKLTDAPSDNGTFISNFFNSIITGRHSNSWAINAIISFLLLIISIALYVFIGNITLKKLGFFGGLTFLVTTIIMIIFSFMAYSGATAHDKAIITSVSTILSTSPRTPKDRSEEAILLHEGTKVVIIDSVTNIDKTKWYDVKVDNNHRAWLNSKDAEII